MRNTYFQTKPVNFKIRWPKCCAWNTWSIQGYIRDCVMMQSNRLALLVLASLPSNLDLRLSASSLLNNISRLFFAWKVSFKGNNLGVQNRLKLLSVFMTWYPIYSKYIPFLNMLNSFLISSNLVKTGLRINNLIQAAIFHQKLIPLSLVLKKSI